MELLGKIGLIIYIIGICWLIIAYFKSKNKKIPVIVIVIGIIFTMYGFTHLPVVEEIEDTKTSDTVEVPEIKDSGDKTEISIEEDITEVSGN